MNEIVLGGCSPTPLASYLKALGVLRLLSDKYPETRAFWSDDRFVLSAALDEQGIVKFFLEDYEPTPIMAPWNGGSGFFEKDNKTALQAIESSTGERFKRYRQCLSIVEQSLAGMDRKASPKNDKKTALLTRIRAQLPDDALSWFDAAVLMAGDSPQYPPLLGTGGNDGRLDFTNNFMQRLTEVLTLNDGEDPPGLSAVWLKTALFGTSTPGLVKKAIGQFSPGQAGGPNASTGFEAESATNPWEFVCMIEGALAFAAATVRRNANDTGGVLSYPFTVRAVGAGSGSLGEGDGANARGELWMPLWNTPATYAEIRALLAEGRVALGRKPARDALDFVRAIHHLGGYRGVQSFQRYGLLMRSGKAYLATPLSRVEVSDEPKSNPFDERDKNHWLDRFRAFARGDNAANRFLMLRKRLEDRLFDLSGHDPAKAEMQSLLILLGEIQQAMAASSKAKEQVSPVPRLSEKWVAAADDGTPEFRIAKALAGLRGVGEEPLPVRAQLFPMHRKFDQWITAGAGEKVRICTGQEGRLVDTLRVLLEHRLRLAHRLEMNDKPLTSPAGATLDDVVAFLQDNRMDARIASLLPGLCLCTIPEDTDHTAGEGMLPAAFGLMKLALTPDRTLRRFERKGIQLLSGSDSVPVPAGMLAQLAAGNHSNRAVETACRRLRASGLTPFFAANTLPTLAGISPARAAAALLIPLRYGATGVLVRSLLEEPETEAEPATTG
jgi:CRISPR-associated protein Csx17